MKNKKKVILSSIMSIALCLSLIAGATFALFTSEKTVNVAVTSGTVDVQATILEDTLETRSLGVVQSNGAFANGGTALFTNEAKLELTNVTPGDKATFTIQMYNNSNVTVQYRVKWAVDGALYDALVATADGTKIENNTSDWAVWSIPANEEEKVKTINVSVELPKDVGNDHQDQNATIAFTVEAVQGNAIVTEVTTVEQLETLLQVGGTAKLMNDLTLEEGVQLTINEDTVVVFDLNDNSILGNIAKADGHVIVNKGTLSIVGGTVSSTAENGGSAIYNSGKMTIIGTAINGAACANGGWASYAINNYGSMTVTDAKIVSNHGGVSSQGGETLTLNNTNITTNGFGGSSHVLYIGGAGSEVIINGGTYTHNGNTDGSLAYIMTGTRLIVNDGVFSASNGAYGMATYKGELVINGGTFNSMPINWGGPITIYGGTFVKDPSTYVADYFEATKETDATMYTVSPKAGVTIVKTADDLKALSATALTSNNNVAEEATIVLLADIDMGNADFSAIVAQRGDTLNFVGNSHTISNVNIVSGINDNTTGQSSMFYAYPNSTLNVSNLTISNVKSTSDDVDSGYAAAVIAYCEGIANLNNVDVVNAEIIGAKNSGVLVGYNSATLTATDCDVTSSTVTLFETSLEPQGHYAGKAIGTINAPATFTNCTFDATVDGSLKASNVGDLYGRNLNKLVVDGTTIIVSDAGLQNALLNGENISLDQDVGSNGPLVMTGGTLNGNGKTISANSGSAAYESGLTVCEGTVSNVTITDAFRALGVGGSGAYQMTGDVYYNNVTVTGATYGINIGVGNGHKVYMNDSTLCDWNSYSGLSGAEFKGCTFTSEGSYYASQRISANATFTYTNCNFEQNIYNNAEGTESYYLDSYGNGTIVFKNCYMDGVLITAENVAELFQITDQVTVTVNNG